MCNAETETTCLVLDRQGFNELLGPLQDLISMNMRFKTLRSVPLLKNLSRKEKMRLAEAMQKVKFTERERIIKEGEPGHVFYMIDEGSVVCTKRGDDGQGEQTLVSLGPGDFFGERALLQARTRCIGTPFALLA